jgi:hypothetical protein
MLKDTRLGRRFSHVKKSRLFKALYSFLVVMGWKKDRELFHRISPSAYIAPNWSDGDDLSQTTGWTDIDIDLPNSIITGV